MKEIELIKKRGKREKHFLQENGTYRAELYDDDIHYFKDGIYREIDNTLVEKNGYFSNKDNSYNVHFSKSSKSDLMVIESKNHYIDFILKNSNDSLVKNYSLSNNKISKISYSNILNEIDFEYDILPTKVKETVVLKDKKFIKDKIEFILETDLELEIMQNKTINAYYNSQLIFTIDEPYMIDSKGDINRNIFYELSKKNRYYELIMHLDTKWLNAIETLYPIKIDPTITTSGQNTKVYDTYIYPGDTNDDRGSQSILKCGVERENNVDTINRTLIKFDLPKIGTGSQVVEAKLNLVPYPKYLWYDTYKYNLLSLHQLTKNWDENTANWNNMSNNYNPKIETVMEGTRSTLTYDGDVINANYASADITNIVKKWYSDTPNYGLMIRQYKENYENDFLPAFFSNNNTVSGSNPKPVLSISYRNQNGLEDYMNYRHYSLSNGKVSLNTYNGNVIASFNLGKTLSSKLAADLNLFYNTNDVILNKNNDFGIGLQMNYNQFVKPILIEEKQYLEYTDSDGTIHYYKEKIREVYNPDTNELENINDTPGVFYDEDGLTTSIRKEDNNYVLIDKIGNKLIFGIDNNIGYLSEYYDLSGASIKIFYDSQKRINKVIDASNNEINLTYSNDAVKIFFKNDTVTLKKENNKLVELCTINGNISLEYNEDGILKKIIDIDGKSLVFDYYSVIPFRIKKVYEVGRNGTIGKSINFSYSFNCTTITDDNGINNIMSYNNIGNMEAMTTFINDNLKDAYSIQQYYGDELNDTNKKLIDRYPIKYVNNYLSNTDFEGDKNLFTELNNCDSSICSENAYNGERSLKLESNAIEASATYSVSVLKGKSYTFSAYIKNSIRLKMVLSYLDSNNEWNIVENNFLGLNEDFERYDLTIEYPTDAKSDLKISFYLLELGAVYIDNIQLEEGEIANEYNYIENSDFSNGTLGWDIDSNYSEVVDINGVKALKTKMVRNNNAMTGISRDFNVVGKKGDRFTLAFWYKNEGSISRYINDVVVNFKWVAPPEYGKCAAMVPLSCCNSEWHYFHCSFTADYDYEGMYVNLYQEDVNDLYVTNFYLIKNESEIYYNYDNSGNVTEIQRSNNYINKFKYDSNNQLIKMTNPIGDSFIYEYDKLVSDRILNCLSNRGINNRIVYDEGGNPVISSTINIGTNQKIEGSYRIRLKGTRKYIRYVNQKVILSDFSECSDSIWIVENNDDSSYFLSLSVLKDKYLKYDKILILNSKDEINSKFEIIKKEDGCCNIKLTSNSKFLKAQDDSLIIQDYEEKNSDYEFYFEKITESIMLENNALYDPNGQYITKIIDSNMNQTLYTADENSMLISSVTNSNMITTRNFYDEKNQLIKVSKASKFVDFCYNDYNMLTKIIFGNKAFNFIYDEFNNITNIKIGNIDLISHIYANNNGDLIKSVYGNNHEISFNYDEFQRIKTVKKMDNIYDYKYRSDGKLGMLQSLGNFIKYYYDNTKKMTKYNFNNELIILYKYNELEKIKCKKINFHNEIEKVNYDFSNDGTLKEISFDDNTIKYTYDLLGRLVKKDINDFYSIEYSYVTNGCRTSNLLSNLKIKIGNFTKEWRYLYNKNKLITCIFEDDSLISKYYYDDFDELITAIDFKNNIIEKYCYDNDGNIMNVQKFNASNYSFIDKNVYYYNDKNWDDKLTKFNNDEIIYDLIGNPIKIGSASLEWVNGRELSRYVNDSLIVEYKYDNNGIRNTKVVNGKKINYYLEGKKILYEDRNDVTLYFLYDDNDQIIGFKCKNNIYYYLKNLQKDIIGIVDNSGNVIVRYTYDSLGNIISIVDDSNINLANLNPFRYRGYYYDNETNLYYLNDRYYNPKWGRFLNADGIINGNKSISGYNLFSYVENDFINKIDENGNIFGIIVKAIVVVAVVKIAAIVGAKVTKNKYPIASKMLDKSLKKQAKNQNKYNSLSKSIKKEIAQRTQNSQQFKNTINDNIKSSDGSSFSFSDGNYSFKDDMDLQLSLGHVRMNLEGVKKDDTTWDITVHMNDVYDYDLFNYFNDSGDTLKLKKMDDLIITFINNGAYLLQQTNQLHEYEWDITYSFEYKTD